MVTPLLDRDVAGLERLIEHILSGVMGCSFWKPAKVPV
jgi:hypothetical protein